jgi:hypothetical protein
MTFALALTVNSQYDLLQPTDPPATAGGTDCQNAFQKPATGPLALKVA